MRLLQGYDRVLSHDTYLSSVPTGELQNWSRNSTYTTGHEVHLLEKKICRCKLSYAEVLNSVNQELFIHALR